LICWSRFSSMFSMHPLSPKPNLPKNAHYHLNTGGIDEPNGIHQDISPFYLIQWYTTRWPTIWKVESLIELKRVNDFYYRPFQTRLRKDLHIYLWTGCVWRKYEFGLQYGVHKGRHLHWWATAKSTQCGASANTVTLI